MRVALVWLGSLCQVQVGSIVYAEGPSAAGFIWTKPMGWFDTAAALNRVAGGVQAGNRLVRLRACKPRCRGASARPTPALCLAGAADDQSGPDVSTPAQVHSLVHVGGGGSGGSPGRNKRLESGRRQDSAPWWAGTALQQHFYAIEDPNELLALLEGRLLPGIAGQRFNTLAGARAGSSKEREKEGMTWREAAVAMFRLKMLARSSSRMSPLFLSSSTSTAPSDVLSPQRTQRAMESLASFIAHELLSACNAVGADTMSDCPLQKWAVKRKIVPSAATTGAMSTDVQQGSCSVGQHVHDGKLLAMSLDAAAAYNGTYILVQACSTLLSTRNFASRFFVLPSLTTLSDTNKVGLGGWRVGESNRGVDMESMAAVLNVLTRHPKCATPEMMEKMGKVVTLSSAIDVTGKQLATVVSALAKRNGSLNEEAVLHLAHVATQLAPHAFTLPSCAIILGALVSRSAISTHTPTPPLPPPLSKTSATASDSATTASDGTAISRLYIHILKALWVISPDQLVPRSHAAVASLSSTIVSLGKLARASKGPFDKQLLIQVCE